MFGDFIDFDDDEDQEHGHAHGHHQGQGQEEERSRQQQQQRYYIGDQLAIGAFGIVPFSPTIVSVRLRQCVNRRRNPAALLICDMYHC